MKKSMLGLVVVAVLVAAAAMAADPRMPVKASPPAPIVPVFTCTGFYIGGEVGWRESRTETVRNIANHSFPAGFTGAFEQSGVLGRGDIGANCQINQFVLGIAVTEQLSQSTDAIGLCDWWRFRMGLHRLGVDETGRGLAQLWISVCITGGAADLGLSSL